MLPLCVFAKSDDCEKLIWRFEMANLCRFFSIWWWRCPQQGAQPALPLSTRSIRLLRFEWEINSVRKVIPAPTEGKYPKIPLIESQKKVGMGDDGPLCSRFPTLSFSREGICYVLFVVTVRRSHLNRNGSIKSGEEGSIAWDSKDYLDCNVLLPLGGKWWWWW